MAGVRENVIIGKMNLVYDLASSGVADGFVTTVLNTMAASGSGEWKNITAVTSGSGGNQLKIGIPNALLINDAAMAELILGTVRDKIIPKSLATVQFVSEQESQETDI